MRRYGPALSRLCREVARQDEGHPSGYPATRDGVLLGIANAVVELIETGMAWQAGRCKCPEPACTHGEWSGVRKEATQVAAIMVRLAAEIDAQDPEAEEADTLACDHCGHDFDAELQVVEERDGRGDVTLCPGCGELPRAAVVREVDVAAEASARVRSTLAKALDGARR